MYENISLYNINKWILWNINNFQEFYTMCSDCIFPASPNSFQTHALSYSPTLHPSPYQGRLVLSRCSWMCNLPPERGTYQGYTLRENWSFLSRQLTLSNSSSARGRPLCPSSPLHAGVWSVMGLHGSCVCCHNYSEFICAAAWLCPEDTVSLKPCLASGV